MSKKHKRRWEPFSRSETPSATRESWTSRQWKRWKPSAKKAVAWTWAFARAETETWLDKALSFIFWAVFWTLFGWTLRAVLYPQPLMLRLPPGEWRVVERPAKPIRPTMSENILDSDMEGLP